MSMKVLIAACVLTSVCLAQSPDLSFTFNEGYFKFDTGKFVGILKADEKSQGLVSLVEKDRFDKNAGIELAKGNPQYGILSFYRLLSADKRWGTVFWEWPKKASVTADGGLQIDWPAIDEHPVDVSGTFKWTSPDTLDLEVVIEPTKDMPKLELFIGSYFKKDARGSVYVAPARHGGGKAELLPVDVNPLTLGTYYAFPRDLKAAQLVYDGRWEQGLHPVQWSITRYLAGPLVVRQDPQTGMSMMLMSRPDDCFSVMCSYNQDPPDGVAGHYSTYLSLFGRDIKAGETARAFVRLVVRKDISADGAVQVYEQFLKEKK